MARTKSTIRRRNLATATEERKVKRRLPSSSPSTAPLDRHRFCGSCGIGNNSLMKLRPQDRFNLHSLEMGSCACGYGLCSECLQVAWEHYDWKWDPEYPGSYENEDDDRLEAVYEFEKDIVRCKACTPEQPVYVSESDQ